LLDDAGNNGLTISSATALALTSSASFLVNNAASLNDAGPLSIGAGQTLTLGSTVAAGTGTIVVSGNIAATTGSLAIADTAGSTAIILSGANGYFGGTTITGASVQLAGSGTLGSTSGALTIAGGVLDLDGTNQSVGALSGTGGTILNNASGINATFTVSGSVNTTPTYSGAIADHSKGTGTLALVKTGSGVEILSGSDTYTGGTTVSGGTLEYTGTSATPFGTGPVALGGGSNLFLSVASSNTTLGAANATPSTNVTYSGGAQLQFASSLQTDTLVLGNAGAALNSVLTRVGNGTLIIGASFGTIVVNGGVPTVNGIVSPSIVGGGQTGAFFLTYSNAAGFNSATSSDTNFAVPSKTSIETVNVNQLGLPSTSVFGMQLSSNILLGSGATLTLGNPGAGPGQSNQTGLLLNPGAGISGGAAISFGDAEGIIYSNPSGVAISTPISGSNGITTFGPGSLTLAGSNTYTGVTTINGNVFNATSLAIEGSGGVPSSLGQAGNSPANLVINGGTLVYTGATAGITDRSFTIGSGGATLSTSVNAGPFTINGSAPPIAFSSVGPATLTLSTNYSPSTFGAVLGDSGNGSNTTALMLNTYAVWNLTAANTYSGGTTVLDGTLGVSSDANLGSDPASPSPGNIVINNGTLDLSGGNAWALNSNRGIAMGPTTGTGFAIIDVSSGTTVTYGGAIANNGEGTDSLYKRNSGTLILSAQSTYSGTTGLIGGTLELNGNGGSLNPNSPLQFSYSVGTFDYQGRSTGSSQTLGALTFSQSDGTVQSTYGGSGTTSLVFSSLTTPATIGATGTFVVSGGSNGVNNKIVLTGVGANSFIGPSMYFGTGGADNYAWYDAGGFVRAITYGSDSGSVTTSGGTSVTGAYVQTTGAITSEPTKSITTLNVNASTAAGGAFTLASGATLTVNGILKTGGGGNGNAALISGGAAIEAASGDTIGLVVRTDQPTDFLQINTPIVAGGGNALTVSGPGVLVLGGSNSYGTTYVNGTLRLTGAGTLGGATASAILNAGALLDLGGTSQSVGQLSISGTVANNASGTVATLTVGSGNANGGVSGAGVIADNTAGTGTLSLIKTGTGSFDLEGLSTYSGGTQILGGTIFLGPSFGNVSGPFGLPSAPVLIGNVSGSNSVSLEIDGPFIVQNNITVQSGSSGAVSFVGIADGISTYSGNLVLNKGVTLSQAAGGTTVFSGSIAGVNTPLNVVGPGTTVLSGPNTFTGGVIISGNPTLNINSDAALGTPPSAPATNITFNSSATLQFAGSFTLNSNRSFVIGSGNTLTLDTGNNNDVFGGAISGSGAAVVAKVGAGMLTLSGIDSNGGGVTISNGTLNINSDAALGASGVPLTFGINGQSGGGGSLQFSTNVSLPTNRSLEINTEATATIDVNGYTVNLNGGIGTGVSINGLSVASTVPGGKLIFSGSDTNQGPTTINAGATLQLSGAGRLRGSADPLIVNGSFDLGGTSQSVSSLNGSGVITNSGTTNSTLTLGGQSIFSGTFQDGNTNSIAANLSNFSAVFSGSSTYSGGTTVASGTLDVNNSSGSATGSGSVVVSAFGVLSGGGTIIPGGGNSVSIQSNGEISGASGGTLTIGGANGTLNLLNGSILEFTPGNPTIDSPLISATTLAAVATVTVNVSNASSLALGTYELVGYANGPAASSPAANFSLASGSTFASGETGRLDLQNPAGGSGPQVDLIISATSGASNSNNPLQFGPASFWSVVAGGSYANDQSSVNGIAAGSPGGGASVLGSTATILTGSNSGAYVNGGMTNVSMAWRVRTLQESSNAVSPPLPNRSSPLVSDVLNLTGMGNGAGEPVQTDPFALQMTYDAALLSNESAQAASGALSLAWFDPNTGFWENAITGDIFGADDTNNAALTEQNFHGSFAAFQAEFGTNLTSYIGAWGVDTTQHDVWAVIDHNSQFAVVPEPSTLVLFGLGAIGLAGFSLQRTRSCRRISSKRSN